MILATLGPPRSSICTAIDRLHCCVLGYAHTGNHACARCDHQWSDATPPRMTVADHDLCWYGKGAYE